MSNAQKMFQELLLECLEELKKKNPRYSLRAFAKKLGVSAGTLSEVLNLKLNLGLKRMEAILENLDLSPGKKNRFLVQLGRTPNYEKQLVSDEAAAYLANWVHRAILHSFDLEHEETSPAKIAERLGISEQEVRACLEQLLKFELIQKSEDQEKYQRPVIILKTNDGKKDENIRRTHLSNFDLQRKAYETIPMEERDFTSMMFAGTQAQMDQMRKEIRALYEKIILTSEVGPRDELYQISVALYPVRFKKDSL